MNSSIPRYLIIVFIFLGSATTAQELVINGSFEDINACSEVNAKCSPAAWFFVNAYGPRGYVHRHPKKATSGKEYLDLMVAAKEDINRTYWQTMLACPLVRGAEYEISFNVAADNVGPNLNDIGFYFGEHFFSSVSDTLLQPATYIAFRDARVKKRENYWFTVSKKFIAAAADQVLVIGNFSGIGNKDIFEKRRSKSDFLNITLDDISIKPTSSSDCSSASNIRDSLYAIRSRHSGRANQETFTGTRSPTIISEPATITEPANITQPGITPKADTIRLSNLLFAYDSDILKDTSSLLQYRQALSSSNITSIAITGFADDRGSDAYNKSLSLRRAEEVKKLLTRLFGISPAIMQATGAGRSATFSDQELNRRVEIYIYH